MITRILIAAVLVLSCVTAKADDVYIWGRDFIEKSSANDKLRQSITASLEKYLRARKHNVVKEWKPTVPTIGFFIIQDGKGPLGVCVTATDSTGKLMGMGTVPDEDATDGDWMAKSMMQELGIW